MATASIETAFAQTSRTIVDSAGRKVQIPDRITRVMAAGPPASVLVYVLAPEKLIGWNRKPYAEELNYLSPNVRDLPELGRLTGRGGTANLEVVIGAKPDIIVDFGSVNATYISLADRVQSQTGIPYVLIDGRFANTIEAIRLLGSILDTQERAEQIARRTEEIFQETDRVVTSIPDHERPRAYLARGPRGLETGSQGSIHTEIIERAGGINVAGKGLAKGNLYNVSLEQVLTWNPNVIFALDPTGFANIQTSSPWSNVEAVRRKQIYLSPRLPFGWVDGPPSINRLVGLQWISRLFFPDRFADDTKAAVRSFYKLFYQVELTDEMLNRLLDRRSPSP